MALWRFTIRNADRTISKVFGIAKSTVIKIVQEVTCALIHVSSEFIKFHLTTLEHATAIKAFAEYTDMLRSELYLKCEEAEEAFKAKKNYWWVQSHPVLLSDGAYPPTSWLVKPHQSNLRLNDSQKKLTNPSLIPE